jgi:hypothetical protein
MNQKVEAEVNAGQLIMFNGANLSSFDQDIGRVFGGKSITDKSGAVVGSRISLQKRSEIAKALELQGKANKEALDAKILEMRDELMRRVKGDIASLPDDWTFKSGNMRELRNGDQQVTYQFIKLNRAQSAVSLETMARALGCTVKELQQKLSEAKAKEAVVNAQEEKAFTEAFARVQKADPAQLTESAAAAA